MTERPVGGTGSPEVREFLVVSDQSKVWCDSRTNAHPIFGVATGLEGTVSACTVGDELDLRVPPRARVELDVERLRSGNWLYDSEVKRLISRRYRRIVGDVTVVEAIDASKGRYLVRGEVTFFGATAPADDEVTVTFVDAGTIVIEGEHVFDVRDFGMEPPRIRWLQVMPEVRVRLRLVAQEVK